MAHFAETGTYLKFSERPRNKSKAILWPVMVHRVLYPEPRRVELNLFQRAVLGLIRAGAKSQDAIANLTGLHPDLIAFIVAQGVSNGWLAPQANELTDKGFKLLDDEEDEAANLKAGYIFQDAISGEYWPRLVTRLEQVEALDPFARFPEFVSERKTGDTYRPFLARAGQVDLPALDNEVLTKAYREYQRDFRSNQQLYGTSGPLKQVRLKGIQHLDESPEPARVLLWVVGDEEGSELWSIKDPFALREDAWWLVTSMKQLLQDNKKLRTFLSPLVGIPDAGSMTKEEWYEALSKKTELDILIKYPWLERQPDIKIYFARLMQWQEKIESGLRWDSDLEAAIGDCQKLLEVVMQWLIKTFPAEHNRISSRSNPKQVLRALTIPSFSNEVVQILARQDIRQVIRACQNPSSSLKALLFAAGMGVLGAKQYQHPLMVLEGEDLRLDILLQLADLRNQSSHGQSSFKKRAPQELSAEVVIKNIRYAQEFTANFKDWM
ncbi:hypothetical protein CLV44_11482 [Marinobacterium halophilum]|uniref:Uncharacterized protein n=1 Tax=Marinobacterium halophilum TaxID=267374 RepID=A0A2P8EUH6_9GAMM|nr:hypothetical protein [Marinobacterium halophilum]PSL13085.1 hypothetical protein CLV44_11482 [Marinobacterium halophilum]